MDVTFKKLTRLEHITSVPERWKEQYYCPTEGWRSFHASTLRKAMSAEVIYNKILALPHLEIQEEAINEIIGNRSWTSFTCDECERESSELLSLDHCISEWTGESFRLCEYCLHKALAVITAEEPSDGNT